MIFLSSKDPLHWADVTLPTLSRCVDQSVQALCPVGDGGDLGLAGEYFAQQDLVYFGVGVQAAVWCR